MPVVVFGSLNVDYLIPAEGALPLPGETVTSALPYTLTPGGGKGMNQAVAARRAGAAVTMIGALGADANGATVRKTLAAEGIADAAIKTGDLPTGTAFIFLAADGENMILVSSGANNEVSAADLRADLLGPETILLFQMEVPLPEIVAALQEAQAAGAKTVLNLAPAKFPERDPEAFRQALAGLDTLIVNQVEAQMLADWLGLAETGPAALQAAIGCAHCIVTEGAAGVQAAGPEGLVSVPSHPVTVRDTTGAGDAFCGGYAAARDAGLPFAEALSWGAVAGALACRAIGCQTALPYAAEIKDAVDGRRH